MVKWRKARFLPHCNLPFDLFSVKGKFLAFRHFEKHGEPLLQFFQITRRFISGKYKEVCQHFCAYTVF